MFSINDLVAGYPGKEVIHHLNLQLRPGVIHGLVGLNGSGKTTLLRCISGVLKPISGQLNFGDQPLLRNQVSYLETEPYFYHGITGREYLTLFSSKSGNSFSADEWADLFALHLDTLVEGYSTGMKKKLGILAMLMMNRELVLLDEPFNGLDLESVRVLSTLLQNWNNPCKVIIVTSHIIETLKDTCTEVHYLNDGIIRHSFTGNDLQQIENVVFRDIDNGLSDKIKDLLQ